VSVPTQVKEVPFWGLLGCILLLAAVGCTRNHDVMPKATHGPMATVALVDHGVDLLTAEENGQPCLELRIGGLAQGERIELSSYSCMQSRDQLVTNFLIADGTQLATGGAVALSVATVTVNGQPTLRDGRYFLTVLPTIPDSGVNVVASDKDGRVVSSQEHSKALITSPRIPSQTSPPPRP
jgi:hypothetical protein